MRSILSSELKNVQKIPFLLNSLRRAKTKFMYGYIYLQFFAVLNMRTNSLFTIKIVFYDSILGLCFHPLPKKTTDKDINAFKTGNSLRKDEFQVLNMENIINNINQFLKINDVIEVAKVKTILSKFQVAIEEVKRKVKRFLQSSQGNLTLVIFDFYCISDNNCNEK